jgi:hypothetical protein
MSKPIEEFLKFAEECEKMAEDMPAHRQALLELAKAWRTAASEHEASQTRAPP